MFLLNSTKFNEKNFQSSFVLFRNGRFAAEPISGLTSLTGEPTGPGFQVRPDL